MLHAGSRLVRHPVSYRHGSHCRRLLGGDSRPPHSYHGPTGSMKALGKTMVEDGSRLEWQRPDIAVVLVHPQIPQNCGNIARTCAASKVALHLVGPMGFELDDTKLKRAGLDYWDWVAVKVHENVDSFLEFFNTLDGEKRLFAYSKFGASHYAQEGLYLEKSRNFLMFGAETSGLPDNAHSAATDVVKIPMSNFDHVRSLNLATSVGIGLFECIRQIDGAVLPEQE